MGRSNTAPHMQQDIQAKALPRAFVIIVAATLMVLTASAVMLWVRYGAAVFFEMIRSGLAACL